MAVVNTKYFEDGLREAQDELADEMTYDFPDPEIVAYNKGKIAAYEDVLEYLKY